MREGRPWKETDSTGAKRQGFCYKKRLDAAVKEKQQKRQKISHTKSKSDKVPQPDLSAQMNITSDKDATVQSATRSVSPATTEKGQSDQSIESFNDQVPESPSPTEQVDMIEAVPGIGHSAMVMPSTQSVSTLPDFYDSMSPLLSDEEDAFINQIVNGNSNLPPISNVNDYSVTEIASSSAQILIQHQPVQPCNQFQRILLTPFQAVQI